MPAGSTCGAPERSLGLKKDSNYHSVEKCHIFVKVRTSEGTLPTSLAGFLSYLFQMPQKGFTDSPQSLRTFFLQNLLSCLCLQHLISNVLVRQHLNLCNWGCLLLNLVLENMILKIGENPLQTKLERG